MSSVLIHCYTCAHHTCRQETVVVRTAKGEKTRTKSVTTERCAARDLVELMLPTVIGPGPVSLLSRQQFEQVVAEAKAEGRPEPFIYGSEGSYPGHRCPLYTKKKRRFYCDR